MRSGFFALSLLLSTISAQGTTYTFDEHCKGYQTYVFSNDGLNFGFNTVIGLVVKRDAYYTLNQSEIGRRARCDVIEIGEKEIEYTEEAVFPYYDQDGNKYEVVIPLAATVAPASESDTIKQVMTMLNYSGYIGNIWLDRGKDYKEVIMSQPLFIFADSFNKPAPSCNSGTVEEKKRHRFNCIYTGYAVDDYFLNDVSYNWALWVLVFYMLGFFFTALCFEDNIPIDYAAESNWSFHPMSSIYARGSNIYTKQSRLANYYFFITSLSFFIALMLIRWEEKHLAIRLLVFPVFGVIFGLITTIPSGYLLNRIYKVGENYVREYKAAENHEQRVKALDNFEKREFQTSYIYYIFLMIGSAHFTIWPIVILQDYHLNQQGFWVVGIIIGIAMDLLGFRMIMVYLVRFEFFKKMFRVYGYDYDAKLQEEYANILAGKD